MIEDKFWTEVTESQFAHEKDGLATLRQVCAPGRVLRAWTNFEFLDEQGRIYEVDALLLTCFGLVLVELKHYNGTVLVDELSWTRHPFEENSVTMKNPLSLANHKCKVLSSRLGLAIGQFSEAVVYLSHPKVRLEFTPASRRQAICDTSNLASFVNHPIGRQSKEMMPRESQERILAGLERLGIVKARKREILVGPHKLVKLLGDGPNFQDHLAVHTSLSKVYARLRTYVGKTPAERERARVTAEREYRLLRDINHDHILKPELLVESELGPTLVFPYFEKAIRLDVAMANKKVQENCGFSERLYIWNCVGEALRYAHQRHLYHRALSPQNVMVEYRENEQWFVRVFNWQTASALEKTSGTVHVTDWLEERFTSYVAPEMISTPNEPDASTDMFSLGCLGYFLFTHQDPAANQTELQSCLMGSSGLNIYSVIDQAPQPLAQLISDLTHPDSQRRPQSAQEFLRRLAEVEQAWRRQETDDDAIKDPTLAHPGDLVAPGCVLQRKLGQGSSSIAFLVKNQQEEELVLKVSRGPGEERLMQEAEILQVLHDKSSGPTCKKIVELRGLVQWSERKGLLLTSAGSETLSERLANKGPVGLELLKRFGDDLLEMVEFLEKKGMAHRDIKPSNLGVRPMGKNAQLHLTLFDFSLAREDRRKVEAGTPGYRDPFLSTTRPWDEAAERFAAAVTLYEMCTTRLPQWGDGRVSPNLIEGIEVRLESGDFEPDLHDEFEDFFRIAFRRDHRERFENATSMRAAWNQIFDDAQLEVTPATVSLNATEITPETSLKGLAKKHSQLKQIFDRLELKTAGQLLGMKKSTLLRLGNVGAATRAQLGDFYDLVKGSLPGEFRPVAVIPAQALESILKGLVPKQHGFLLEYLQGSQQREWPLASELAPATPASKRQEYNRAATAQRQVWAKNPDLASLADELAGALEDLGGAATVEELCETLLGLRGSLSNEPQQRYRTARGVLRALIEVEGMQSLARFDLYQTPTADLVCHRLELVDQLGQAAQQADLLVSERPLPSPQKCLTVLAPLANWDYAPLGRLPKLVTALAEKARLSSRDEFYPVGMEPLLSLQLCSNALLGREWSLVELQEFVYSRYPESAPLPGWGEISRLLQSELNLPFGWDEKEQKFRSTTANPTSATRTSHSPSESAPVNELEQRLQQALRAGEPQVLKVRRSEIARAEEWLLKTFGLPTVSLEQKLIAGMIEIARAENIEARDLWQADQLGPQSPEDWAGLCDIAREAAQKVVANLAPQAVLKRFSLWGRYGLFPLLSQAIEEASRSRQPRTLWMLAPNDEGLPKVDDRPLPIPPATKPIHWSASSWLR